MKMEMSQSLIDYDKDSGATLHPQGDASAPARMQQQGAVPYKGCFKHAPAHAPQGAPEATPLCGVDDVSLVNPDCELGFREREKVGAVLPLLRGKSHAGKA